ncbi:MAG: hypothetical protein Q9P01_08190 [Anaerolineae bacterium]|nr:hypothetical protein [Anaerolineae bacterium]MDQ7034803.1 hypothetical protein [Anaerolineae bacterium]
MSEFVPAVSAIDEVLDFLVSTPTPQQIVKFHASEAAQLRLRYLLEANRNGTLTPEERAELDEAERLNHFIMMLKIRAHKAMKQS